MLIYRNLRQDCARPIPQQPFELYKADNPSSFEAGIKHRQYYAAIKDALAINTFADKSFRSPQATSTCSAVLTFLRKSALLEKKTKTTVAHFE